MKPTARLLAFVGAAIWSLSLAGDRFDRWVETTDLPSLSVPVSATVLDRDGQVLRAYMVEDGLWRLPVDTAQLDPRYVSALLAYEDKRFYAHRGVDPKALARAGWQMLVNGRVVSGGSTLTMQVARLLERSGTGRIAGKLRQMRVALALERRLTKAQILTLYARLAPMGANLEGVRAGSLAWFGKEPGRLTEAQIALLIALPQSPEMRRPDQPGGKSLAARNRVLERLRDNGTFSAGAVTAAMGEAMPVRRHSFPSLAPHLSDRMRQDHPMATTVSTTLRGDLQAALEDLAASSAQALGSRINAALLVTDHRTGQVLASVGSAGFTDRTRRGFVDMTRALRSPGSTLKPLIYGLAFDAGLAHPETLIDDVPHDFGGYAPQNFDRRFHGTLRVREALQLSLNLPAVALLDAVGPQELVQRMRRAGARVALPGDGRAGLAVALGGVGVTMEGLAQIYGGLANGGRVQPLVWTYPGARPPAPRRLMSPEAAWMVGDILAGLAPPPGALTHHLAYKTGTSYGNRDAWAVGFDGEHVIVAWIGRTDGTAMPGALGAELAAPMLFEAFARLKAETIPLGAPPASVLLVPNAALPQPLRRFLGPRDRNIAAQTGGPSIDFPPDGALVDLDLDRPGKALPLFARVSNGNPPFTWLANGRPIVVGTHDRSVQFRPDGKGAMTLSVVDAKGASQQVRVTLE